MNKSIFFSVALISFILLSACASTSSSKDAAKVDALQVNENTITSEDQKVGSNENIGVNTNAELARVLMVRDFVAPIALKATIKINDEKVGRLKNAQYLETFVPAGDHVLSVSFSKLATVSYTHLTLPTKA